MAVVDREARLMTRTKKQQVMFVTFIVFLGVLFGAPTVNARVPVTKYTEVIEIPQVIGTNNQVFLPLTSTPPQNEWPMLAANPQRTSWTPEEVRGNLSVVWYRPIEPYIPYKVQPIA